jgi:hAT family protein
MMAVEFLTISSSSAETERDFSSVGRIITELRSGLGQSFVARAQCLRSRGKAGAYKLSIQFDSLNNENQRDVVRED